MKKIYWLFIFLFSIFKAQVNVIDLSTGRFDDGSVMPIEIEDPDWKCIRPDGSEHIARTRHTYSGWYYPQFKDNTYNERWITGAPGDPGEGYFIYKSKSFVVPKGSKANLEIRTLAFMRQWTYIVKEELNGKEEESQITQTTWMNDGAKGWFNSRNPLVEKTLEPGTYHIKVKIYVNSSRARQSINVASKVYISPSDKSVRLDTNTDKIESEETRLSENSVSIYPNPTHGLFTISLDRQIEGVLHIMNSNGNIVYTKEIKEKEINVDIQGQPAGIYFIKIQSNKTTLTKKIIIN